MDNKIKELLKKGCAGCEVAIDNALDDAYKYIITIVKECGGLLKTPASPDKPALFIYYKSSYGRIEKEKINGLRYDDELGLTICTNSMLDKYQDDNLYYFDCYFDEYFDFKGEDLENLNKALDDPSYFVGLDKYDLFYADTICSIIGGIGDYIE